MRRSTDAAGGTPAPRVGKPVVRVSIDGEEDGVFGSGGGDEHVRGGGVLAGVDVVFVLAAQRGDLVGDVAVGVEDVLAFLFVVGAVAAADDAGGGIFLDREGIGF